MDQQHLTTANPRPDFSTTPIGVGVGVSPGIGVGVGSSSHSNGNMNNNGDTELSLSKYADMLNAAALPPEFFDTVAEDGSDLQQVQSLDHASLAQAHSQALDAGSQGLDNGGLGGLQGDGGMPLLAGEQFDSQDSGTPMGGKSRKRKLQLACHFCRRRKLKCDGVHPTCENCMKRNEVCSWDDNVRRRGPGKRTKAQRERAMDDAAQAGLHNAAALEAAGVDEGDMSGIDGMYGEGDQSVIDQSVADGVDTNAALIAAVTAAAAEGHGLDPDAFGGEHVSATVPEYHHLSPLPTQHQSSSPIPQSATLQPPVSQGHAGSSPLPGAGTISHQSTPAPSSASLPIDPNIDPSLSEFSAAAAGITPTTLSEADSPKKRKRKLDPVGVAVQPGAAQGYGIGVGGQHLQSAYPQAQNGQGTQAQEQHVEGHDVGALADLDEHALDTSFDLSAQYGLQEWDETHI